MVAYRSRADATIASKSGSAIIVIMRPRGVEQDQVKPAVDHRADDPALAPQFVAVEMLVIELEAVG